MRTVLKYQKPCVKQASPASATLTKALALLVLGAEIMLFRDDIIEIVKKYGIAAAASMYGMSAVDEAMASEGP